MYRFLTVLGIKTVLGNKLSRKNSFSYSPNSSIIIYSRFSRIFTVKIMIRKKHTFRFSTDLLRHDHSGRTHCFWDFERVHSVPRHDAHLEEHCRSLSRTVKLNLNLANTNIFYSIVIHVRRLSAPFLSFFLDRYIMFYGEIDIGKSFFFLMSNYRMIGIF